MTRHLLLVLCALFLFGCEQQSPENTQPQANSTLKPMTLLKDPVELTLVETATEALINWRQHAQRKPALVLVSNNPFLLPIPERYHEKAIQLVTTGTAQQIKQQAVDISSNPTLLHDMALSAALSAELFSEVVWLFPSTDTSKPLNLEEFKNQLLSAGVASQEEVSSFTVQDNALSGRIRDTPFKAVSQKTPLALTSPAVVHIDLSYFQPLYQNEVKTPLYPLLAEHLGKLRDLNIQVTPETVTLSLSNMGGSIPLAVRFVGQDIKTLIKDPTLLSTQLSEFWFHRQQSLFLPNFFKNDEAFEHLLAMEKIAPQEAAVQFALYAIQRELKNGDEALIRLDKAIQLDAGYATEYQNLSHIAITKGQPLAALKMLTKARTQFPSNPLIELAIADIQLSLGQRAEALELLQKLSTLPWSDVYDSEMPVQLEKMITAAKQPPAVESH